MATQEVTLQPNESKVIAFQAVPTEARTYQVTVDGLTGSFRAVALPPPPGYANLYGRVTDANTIQPIAGAEVRVLAGTVIKGTTTQADGTYLISDLSPGATIWACLANGYNIITDQPITLVEGNNELNIALTPIGGPPPPPPPGLANLYGIVTDAVTGVPVVGALVDLSGMPRYTNSAGGFLFQYLTPGQYALTVTKGGYLEFRINLMVAEGNNQYDVSLTQPILGAVTINSFEIQCDFAGETVNTRITITNNTGQTLIDQTPTGPYGGLVTQMGADAYKAPATDYGYHMDDVFLPRPWDRYGIGNVPPGTHIFSSSEPLRRVGEGIPRFQAWGVSEGTRGYVFVWLRSGDETTATFPIVVNEFFEGMFSSSWRTWAKTSWRPPPMPDIFIP